MPEDRKLRFDGTINIGSIIQIGMIIISIAMGYSAFDKRISIMEMQNSAMREQVVDINNRTIRMEHFLIAHNPEYNTERKP